jgi:hypothetical protein
MSNKTNLRAGDWVKVIQYHDRTTGKTTLADTFYLVRGIDGSNGYRCFISEWRKRGGLCAPQEFDVSLLEKVSPPKETVR